MTTNFRELSTFKPVNEFFEGPKSRASASYALATEWRRAHRKIDRWSRPGPAVGDSLKGDESANESAKFFCAAVAAPALVLGATRSRLALERLKLFKGLQIFAGHFMALAVHINHS